MTHLSNYSNDTILFKGFVTLTSRLEHSKMGPHPYITVHTKPHSVIIIPMHRNGSFLIIREMRYAVHKRVLSFPAGLVDDDEPILEAAKRELLEETGYCSSQWSKIGSCYPLPGLLQQTMHVFVAKEVEQCSSPKLDAIEDIEIERIDLKTLKRAFSSQGSENLDANALAAFAMFVLHQ